MFLGEEVRKFGLIRFQSSFVFTVKDYLPVESVSTDGFGFIEIWGYLAQ